MGQSHQPGFYDLRVNCRIISVENGGDMFQSLVVLEPLGSGLKFAVSGPPLTEVMRKSQGLVVRASLSSEYSEMSISNDRVMTVKPLDCEDREFSCDQFDSYRAVGQYMGSDGTSFFVQSLFVIEAERNTAPPSYFPQSIGEWVQVEGSLFVIWDESDVFWKTRTSHMSNS